MEIPLKCCVCGRIYSFDEKYDAVTVKYAATHLLAITEATKEVVKMKNQG